MVYNQSGMARSNHDGLRPLGPSGIQLRSNLLEYSHDLNQLGAVLCHLEISVQSGTSAARLEGRSRTRLI